MQTSEDLTLRVWDSRDRLKVAQEMKGSMCFPLCCDVSPDGMYFLTGCNGFGGGGGGSGCQLQVL